MEVIIFLNRHKSDYFHWFIYVLYVYSVCMVHHFISVIYKYIFVFFISWYYYIVDHIFWVYEIVKYTLSRPTRHTKIKNRPSQLLTCLPHKNPVKSFCLETTQKAHRNHLIQYLGYQRLIKIPFSNYFLFAK